MKQTSAAPWIVLLAISAVGETVAFVLAIVYCISAFGQTDPVERSRLWAAAGWWLLGWFAFMSVSGWSFLRLLRIIARQAPGALTEGSQS